MGLPALPLIGKAFHASETMTGLTLSLFAVLHGLAMPVVMLGFALASSGCLLLARRGAAPAATPAGDAG
ncbi:MAG: hypothetical protein P4L36_08705 [Holophaga sp.]|nr:hypothetical protein [Holophaga sp.]